MESIIRTFLNNDIVKANTDISTIRRMNRSAETQRVNHFKKIISIGENIDSLGNFFDSEQGKQVREDIGLDISWRKFLDAIEIGSGWRACLKQRQAYKNSLVVGIDDFIVQGKAFTEEFGKKFTLAIEKWNKYCALIQDGVEPYEAIKIVNGQSKAESNGEESNEESDGEESTESDGTCTHTFVDKTNGVSFRIENGQLVTSNDQNDIINSLTELLAIVSA
jgi:hypothetical protein